ncbi:hypothetical protein WR25_00228 [Diploscapter pachys]|uniref:Uncharacterized protein n=1 Tax=Diploscapter pachys TaxID=2018661 RepID=A0A2A2K2R9_9BILA|nr:hypothetical protein WR25_00228 [Diploscapter pachys]
MRLVDQLCRAVMSAARICVANCRSGSVLRRRLGLRLLRAGLLGIMVVHGGTARRGAEHGVTLADEMTGRRAGGGTAQAPLGQSGLGRGHHQRNGDKGKLTHRAFSTSKSCNIGEPPSPVP